MASTTRQKIAYNATFSSIAKVIDTLLALVIVAMLTRYLGPAGYGDYSIIFTFGYMFIVLADLGLYSITVREISQNASREGEIISNALTLRMVSTALIFFLGILAVFLFPYKNEVRVGVIIASAGFLASFSSQVLLGIFQKNLRIDRASLADLTGRIIQLVLIVFIVNRGLPFLSIIIAFSVSSIASFAVYVWFAKKFVKFGLAANFEVWKKMLRQGWSLAVSAILIMLYFRLNIITLSLIKGEEAVGIFSVAYKILENLIFFPAMFVGLVMPIMSRAAKDDILKFKDILHKVFNTLAIFLFPLIAIILILSKDVVHIITGKNFDKFSGSAGVLDILIFATVLIYFGTLFSNAIVALKEQRRLVRIYLAGAILNFIMNLILIPSMSYIGAAWSTLVTEFLVTMLMISFIWKKTGYVPRIARLPKILLSTIAASAAVLAIKNAAPSPSPYVMVALLLTSGAFVYFSVLYFLGGIKASELGLFIKKNEDA